LRGRVARLPFFIRCLYLNIAAAVLFAASLPLFSEGGRVLWFAGVFLVVASLTMLIVGIVFATERRLDDIGLSGYHVIWVGAAEAGWTALSYALTKVALTGLPLAAIGLWLTFWPGSRGANRFGERSE
jgi:uncharacterized membrane protein YhaH (DUF805 family)